MRKNGKKLAIFMKNEKNRKKVEKGGKKDKKGIKI